MKVELINHTPEPEKTVAAAARLCYSPLGASEIMDGLDELETTKFLAHLVEVGHLSPLEHVSFTFAVEGVSRALSHQMVRHRMASYSQKSQRYVSEENFDYVIPPSVEQNPAAREVFLKTVREIGEAYRQLAAVVPREDARYLLPNACETKFVATYNARSLLNFFNLRCCNRAQWEIRRLAKEMRILVREAAPGIFQKAGPNCEIYGICYEGPRSCGRAKVIKKRTDEIS